MKKNEEKSRERENLVNGMNYTEKNEKKKKLCEAQNEGLRLQTLKELNLLNEFLPHVTTHVFLCT